jgi:serine/threonine protein kinase
MNELEPNWHHMPEVAAATGAENLKLIEAGENSRVYSGIINNRKTAIKLAVKKNAIQNINREIALMKACRHQNLAEYISDGKIRTCRKTMRYIIEEFVEGETIGKLIETTGSFSWQAAADYTLQMCNFLDKLHRTGRMFVDLKPDNMIINPRNILKFIDLGSAQKYPCKAAQGEGPVTAVGTMGYVCPDWMTKPTVDSRADLYALGILLYEMLAGRPPFMLEVNAAERIGGRQHAINTFMDCHLFAERPDLGRRAPPKLKGIFTKLMEPDIRLRYQTADQIIEDLYTL